MEKTIKIMLVDDHAVVRAGYQMLMKSSSNMEVVAEAESGEEACRLYTSHEPDVVVMDLSLPGIGGIETIRRILARDSKAVILAFSMHEVEEVLKGNRYVDEKLQRLLDYEKSRGSGTPLSDLSTREFEIFCMLAEGMNTSEIAKRLSISYKTVANYSTQIKSKLNAATSADIARLAIRYNIIQA